MPMSRNAGPVSGASLLPVNQAAGASPYTYTNANAYVEDILVAVGTVSLIEFSRDGVTWYTTGMIAGLALERAPGRRPLVSAEEELL